MHYMHTDMHTEFHWVTSKVSYGYVGQLTLEILGKKHVNRCLPLKMHVF